ncbi:RDD family protein [Litoribrevibacter albus]|uniref:RDD family protein n=1 Tax=Litoribrevibacter albus TaxID=1473156 RepID=A0AA37W9Y2_9GAMM|nr:RDD family protein [Litoribrevibacter albus]GLQ33703.1 RDD family protein [Litoribrevibacter albus]
MSERSLEELTTVGFGPRVGATLIDTLLLGLITDTVLLWAFGRLYFVDATLAQESSFDEFMLYIFPMLVVIGCWMKYAATPGKALLDLQIVDARTGGQPTVSQWIIRYLGYFVSVLPLGLGLFWVIWDKKNQGWHDKMAKTLVVEQDGFEALNQELNKAVSDA